MGLAYEGKGHLSIMYVGLVCIEEGPFQYHVCGISLWR